MGVIVLYLASHFPFACLVNNVAIRIMYKKCCFLLTMGRVQ